MLAMEGGGVHAAGTEYLPADRAIDRKDDIVQHAAL